jgi:SAM-dependent methyltransferase
MTQSGTLTHDAARFYATTRGQVAAAILGRAIRQLWPDLAGFDVLGVGYPMPILGWTRPAPGGSAQTGNARAHRNLAAVTSQHAPPYESGHMAGAVCAAEADHLPFPDLAFDRILLVHGVEPAGSPERLLREAWRLLRDDGRLLVVASNRTGLWANAESTPFGQGQPYSQRQVDRLLARAMFRPERHRSALFVPPVNWSLLLRTHALWEQAGRALLPQLAGALLTEAVKDAYAAVPIVEPAWRRVVLPEAA